jgi:hypothetical protein
MGVHETGQNNLAGAVKFDNLLAMLPDPGIAQGVFGPAGGDDLLAHAQHRAVFDDAEFLEFRTAAWAGVSGRRSQRKQLSDVNKEQRTLGR